MGTGRRPAGLLSRRGAAWPVMVLFRQIGGYAGLSLGCELDADVLSAGERSALRSLLTADERETAGVPSLSRDLETYELTIDDGHRERVYRFNQASMPEGVDPLLDRLKREAGPRPLP